MRPKLTTKDIKGEILSSAHWVFEDYRQRMVVADWRKLLLNEMDSVILRGHVRRLIAKNIGAGVVEVYKAPEEEAKP
jgi:hypothetical protein